MLAWNDRSGIPLSEKNKQALQCLWNKEESCRKPALKISKIFQLKLGGEGVIWEELGEEKKYEQMYVTFK